jgi:hypothetical protein
MNPPWRLGLFADTGYEVLWEDAERIFCKTWRMGVAGDRWVVLAVLYVAEYPSPENLSRLAYEYTLRDELDGAWAAGPLELIRERGRPMLILEYPGGEPLGRLIGPPMSMERFLRLAVSLAAALGRLHERGLIHKDIKPVNYTRQFRDGPRLADGLWHRIAPAARLPGQRRRVHHVADRSPGLRGGDAWPALGSGASRADRSFGSFLQVFPRPCPGRRLFLDPEGIACRGPSPNRDAARSSAPPEKLEETIFEIVNQLNRGSHLITSIEELERVAELNFRA